MTRREKLLGVLLGCVTMFAACGTSNLDSLTLSDTLTAVTATISGNETVGGTLAVTGASTLTGNTSVGGTLTTTGAATLGGLTSVVLTNGDLTGTCTVGQLKIDTAGTKELCYCFATNTQYCWSATTATGPTD